jgi:hypothetical protein
MLEGSALRVHADVAESVDLLLAASAVAAATGRAPEAAGPHHRPHTQVRVRSPATGQVLVRFETLSALARAMYGVEDEA